MWRPQIEIERNPDTQEITIAMVWWPSGLSCYHHWRPEDKQRTHYLGIELPDDESQDADLSLPEPQPITNLSSLVR